VAVATYSRDTLGESSDFGVKWIGLHRNGIIKKGPMDRGMFLRARVGGMMSISQNRERRLLKVLNIQHFVQ
jgi:hypothetical protein